MLKKIAITLAAFLLVGACVYGAGALVEAGTAVRAIEADSACPVAGCASGECHGYENVPAPDGVHEMVCPKAGCSSTECHAWDTLLNRYHRASDASLSLWILAPVVLVVALVAIVGAVSKAETRRGPDGKAARETCARVGGNAECAIANDAPHAVDGKEASDD